MLRLLSPAFLALLVSIAWAPPAFAFDLEDERLGFAISVPKSWAELPLPSGEPWVVARYRSKKTDRYRDPNLEALVAPALTIVVFLAPEGEEGSEPPRFANYTDYLRETQGGFYIEAEEELEHKGIEVHQFEVNVNADGKPPMRLYTWVYQLEVGELAVQFELLQETFSKHRKTLNKSLKSLKLIERTRPLRGGSDAERESLFSWRIDAAEREERRKRAESEQWESAVEGLPEGWKSKKIKGFPVVGTDMRFAKEVAESLAGVHAWLDDELEVIGKGEYARRPLIRVFEDQRSEREFRTGLAPGATEVVTNVDGAEGLRKIDTTTVVFVGDGIGLAKFEAMVLWLRDRDEHVLRMMPPWLYWGLTQLAAQSEPKGKRLSFPVTDFERAGVPDADVLAPRELLRMSHEELREASDPGLKSALALARHFMVEPAGKDKLARAAFETYLRTLAARVAEARSEWLALEEELVESGEAGQAIEQRHWDYWEEQRAAVEAAAFEAAFGSWTDDQWAALAATHRDAL